VVIVLIVDVERAPGELEEAPVRFEVRCDGGGEAVFDRLSALLGCAGGVASEALKAALVWPVSTRPNRVALTRGGTSRSENGANTHTGRVPIECWSNAGDILVKYWSNAGKVLACRQGGRCAAASRKRILCWPYTDAGATPVKYWSNTGTAIVECGSNTN
jgi:hypothetical protein